MTGFDPDELDAARRRTAQRLGSAVESKASDRFCLAFAGERPGLAPEALGRVPAVIEFNAGDDPPPADVRVARETFLRAVGPARDELQRAVAALELATRRAGAPEAVGAAPRVQTCWLNRTIRLDADPRALADVAADGSVQRLDVPRRLEPDQLGSDASLIAAAALRETEGLTGEGVTVGVIDSEVALRHPAFQDRVIHRQNFTSEPFGNPALHGTAVAGFVGASALEFSGMAPGATIANYKVIATVPTFNGDDFDGALAIQQALEDGVRVVNCSWGAGPATDGTSREARACDTAWELGLTVVKSAGNRGPGRSTLTTPADAEGVIAVGATDGPGEALADYSSRGPTEDGRQRPHLLAPGGSDTEGLLSALVGGGFGDVGQGTSYAAPHVVGLLALLLEREPDLTPTEQRDRLLGTCTEVAGLDPDLQGAGLLAPDGLF